MALAFPQEYRHSFVWRTPGQIEVSPNVAVGRYSGYGRLTSWMSDQLLYLDTMTSPYPITG